MEPNELYQPRIPQVDYKVRTGRNPVQEYLKRNKNVSTIKKEEGKPFIPVNTTYKPIQVVMDTVVMRVIQKQNMNCDLSFHERWVLIRRLILKRQKSEKKINGVCKVLV